MTLKSFNYSALTTFRRCKQLYKYLYVDKLTPDVPRSGDMAWGTGMHLGVEGYLEGEDGLRRFNTYWDIERKANNRYGRYSWEALRDQAQILLPRFERLYLKKFKVFQMEKRLYGTIGQVKVEGTPDFLGEYEGVPTLLDFKTSGYRYPKAKTQISEQLYLYAHLAAQSENYPVKQLVYFVFVKGSAPGIQVLTRKVTDREMGAVLKDLEETVEDVILAQEKQRFTMNRGSCIMGEIRCDFFERCHGKEE